MSALRCGHAALAALAALLGVYIALHHPLWPVWLTAAFLIWAVAFCLRPLLWPFVLPALLPVASFSAWTGWIGVEEFDLLALAAVLACHVRMTIEGRHAAVSAPAATAAAAAAGAREVREYRGFAWARVALAALALSFVFALWRGLNDGDGRTLAWFQGYEEPLNSLRVAKSLLLALLLLPAWYQLQRGRPALLAARLTSGLVTGMGLLSLAVVWERHSFPGLLDFSTPYRTTALFWEMHVGGAALDGFLALTIPFVVHAVLHAPNRLRWCLAAALAVLATYAVLTTFSRGVYLGAALSLALLAWLLAARRSRPSRLLSDCLVPTAVEPERWRRWGNRWLCVVLVCEVVVVLALGDFMGRRLAASDRDLGGRLEHWSEGLRLLRAPSEVLLGRGLGRFPANYSQAVPARALPGSRRLVDEHDGDAHLRLAGPPPEARRRGAFELLQRVPLVGGSQTLAFDLRNSGVATLSVAVCQRHLLYETACRQRLLVLDRTDPGWRHFSLPLEPEINAGVPDWPPALAFFGLRLMGAGAAIDVDNLRLLDARGRQLLHNGDFSDGLAHWFFAGRHYFVPWHVDSVFLEMLIDQGVSGLLLLLALLAIAVANLLRGPGSRQELAPYLLAALTAFIVVGTFSSLLDMPRTAFLFFLLLCSALFLDGRRLA